MFDLSDFAKMTNSDSEDENTKKKESEEVEQVFEEKTLDIHGTSIKIREFHFSTTNAGYIWPSTYTIIDYILAHKELFQNKRIIELGSATGILSIYLNSNGFDVTSSDYNNDEISENIEYNKSLNNVNFRHIPHTWGDTFEEKDKEFDIVIASDILLYVMYFEKLMLTLRQLMDDKPNSFMLMAYGRKLYDSKKFFVLLEENDFQYELVGSKMWIIKKKLTTNK